MFVRKRFFWRWVFGLAVLMLAIFCTMPGFCQVTTTATAPALPKAFDAFGFLLSKAAMIPAVGAYLAMAASLAAALITLLNALVAAWHGIVQALHAIAVILRNDQFHAWADKLVLDEYKVQDGESKAVAVLDWVTQIKLPQKVKNE